MSIKKRTIKKAQKQKTQQNSKKKIKRLKINTSRAIKKKHLRRHKITPRKYKNSKTRAHILDNHHTNNNTNKSISPSVKYNYYDPKSYNNQSKNSSITIASEKDNNLIQRQIGGAGLPRVPIMFKKLPARRSRSRSRDRYDDGRKGRDDRDGRRRSRSRDRRDDRRDERDDSKARPNDMMKLDPNSDQVTEAKNPLIETNAIPTAAAEQTQVIGMALETDAAAANPSPTSRKRVFSVADMKNDHKGKKGMISLASDVLLQKAMKIVGEAQEAKSGVPSLESEPSVPITEKIRTDIEFLFWFYQHDPAPKPPASDLASRSPTELEAAKLLLAAAAAAALPKDDMETTSASETPPNFQEKDLTVFMIYSENLDLSSVGRLYIAYNQERESLGQDKSSIKQKVHAFINSHVSDAEINKHLRDSFDIWFIHGIGKNQCDLERIQQLIHNQVNKLNTIIKSKSENDFLEDDLKEWKLCGFIDSNIGQGDREAGILAAKFPTGLIVDRQNLIGVPTIPALCTFFRIIEKVPRLKYIYDGIFGGNNVSRQLRLTELIQTGKLIPTGEKSVYFSMETMDKETYEGICSFKLTIRGYYKEVVGGADERDGSMEMYDDENVKDIYYQLGDTAQSFIDNIINTIKQVYTDYPGPTGESILEFAAINMDIMKHLGVELNNEDDCAQDYEDIKKLYAAYNKSRKSEDEESLQMSEDEESLQMSEDEESLQMSEDEESLQMIEQYEHLRVRSEDATKMLTFLCEKQGQYTFKTDIKVFLALRIWYIYNYGVESTAIVINAMHAGVSIISHDTTSGAFTGRISSTLKKNETGIRDTLIHARKRIEQTKNMNNMNEFILKEMILMNIPEMAAHFIWLDDQDRGVFINDYLNTNDPETVNELIEYLELFYIKTEGAGTPDVQGPTHYNELNDLFNTHTTRNAKMKANIKNDGVPSTERSIQVRAYIRSDLPINGDDNGIYTERVIHFDTVFSDVELIYVGEPAIMFALGDYVINMKETIMSGNGDRLDSQGKQDGGIRVFGNKEVQASKAKKSFDHAIKSKISISDAEYTFTDPIKAENMIVDVSIEHKEHATNKENKIGFTIDENSTLTIRNLKLIVPGFMRYLSEQHDAEGNPLPKQEPIILTSASMYFRKGINLITMGALILTCNGGSLGLAEQFAMLNQPIQFMVLFGKVVDNTGIDTATNKPGNKVEITHLKDTKSNIANYTNPDNSIEFLYPMYDIIAYMFSKINFAKIDGEFIKYIDIGITSEISEITYPIYAQNKRSASESGGEKLIILKKCDISTNTGEILTSKPILTSSTCKLIMYGGFLIYNEYLALLDIIREQRATPEWKKMEVIISDVDATGRAHNLPHFRDEFSKILNGDVGLAGTYFEIYNTILSVEATLVRWVTRIDITKRKKYKEIETQCETIISKRIANDGRREISKKIANTLDNALKNSKYVPNEILKVQKCFTEPDEVFIYYGHPYNHLTLKYIYDIIIKTQERSPDIIKRAFTLLDLSPDVVKTNKSQITRIKNKLKPK